MEIPIDLGTLPPVVGIVMICFSLLLRYRKTRQDAIDLRTTQLLDRYQKDAETARIRAHDLNNQAFAAELRAKLAEQKVGELEHDVEELKAAQQLRPARRREASP